MIKRLHYISGIILSIFIMAHLGNHLMVLSSPDDHLNVMDQLRKVYRHPIVERFLLLAVIVQVFSGIKLYRELKTLNSGNKVDKYQILTGLYLAFFLLLHVSAVLMGRLVFDLDTNLYFGAAGLNKFPLYLFFIPYYLSSVLAVFGHIACIHFRKTQQLLQSQIIFGIGLIMAVLILFGMMGLTIPSEYYEPYGM